jgi:hypothetical protein
MREVVERLAIQPINTQEIDPRYPFKIQSKQACKENKIGKLG